VGPACTGAGPGVAHKAACVSGLSMALGPAVVWTYVSAAAQIITVTACIPTAASLMPVLTVRTGCSGAAEVRVHP
jgi:hypothetical protein